MRRIPLALLITPIAAILLGIIIFPRQSQQLIGGVTARLAPILNLTLTATPLPTSPAPLAPTTEPIPTKVAIATTSPTSTPLPPTATATPVQTTARPTATATPTSTPTAAPTSSPTSSPTTSPTTSPQQVAFVTTDPLTTTQPAGQGTGNSLEQDQISQGVGTFGNTNEENGVFTQDFDEGPDEVLEEEADAEVEADEEGDEEGEEKPDPKLDPNQGPGQGEWQGPPRPPFWPIGPINLGNIWFWFQGNNNNNQGGGGANQFQPPQFPPPKPGNQDPTQLVSSGSDVCDIPIPGINEATLAVIPDTQKAVRHYPRIYLQQMDWLAKNRQKYSMVVFLGDLVDLDTPAEWVIFDQGIKLLEAKSIPYAVVTGNHDYPNTNRSGGSRGFLTKNYNRHWNVTQTNGFLQVKNAHGQVRNMPTLRGVFENSLDNSYHTFSTVSGNRQFLLLMLEFGPRDRVLRWANEVIKNHPDHDVIVTTHTYLNPEDGKRQSYTKHGHRQDYDVYSYGLAKEKGYINTYDRPPNAEGSVNDGEQIWDKLVKNNQRSFLVLSGHLFAGVADVVDTNRHGERVCQVVTDYQAETLGGNGWSRFLRLLPADEPKQQQVVSTLFSPVTGQCRKHTDTLTFTKNLCLSRTPSRPAPGFGGGAELEPPAANETVWDKVRRTVIVPIKEFRDPEDHP